MAQSNFVDYVKIMFRSGKGGSGSRHLHRAKYVPKGGPDGGDGGRGGNIILEGDENVWTLLPLKYRKHIFAGNGESGGKNNMTGADGEDVIVKVPPGTVAKDAETGEIDVEITEHGQRHILLRGGRGGLGNSHFKSSTNQTPRYAQTGEEGSEAWKILELKVLADVGLVGFPNAGKSTLLSVLSAAKPKIADYAFTTLVPNLGIVNYRNIGSFVIADIPGIIEGAHEGKGLGHRFLRHIERNAILLFMVSAEADNITEQYRTLVNELYQYKEELIHKSRILAISKSDLLDEELKDMIKSEIDIDVPVVFISSVSQQGLDVLKDKLWELLQEREEEE